MPTHASNGGQNVALSLRRSAGSVRDISHSSVSAASSANHNEKTSSSADLPESSGTTKQHLSASTGHLGARDEQKSAKGTSRSADNNAHSGTDGKNL